jgi:hypothetical protein
MISPYRSISVLNNLRQLPLDCARQTVWYSPVGYELSRISMFRRLSVYYLVQDIQGSQGGTSSQSVGSWVCHRAVLGVSEQTHCRHLPNRTFVMGHEKITAPTTEQRNWHTRQCNNRTEVDATQCPFHILMSTTQFKNSQHTLREMAEERWYRMQTKCAHFTKTLPRSGAKQWAQVTSSHQFVGSSSSLEPCNRWLAAPDFV